MQTMFVADYTSSGISTEFLNYVFDNLYQKERWTAGLHFFSG